MLALIVQAIARGVGMVAAPLLMLCYPLFSYAASTLYPQSLGTPLFVAVIFVLLRFPHNSRAALAAGLVFGFLVLTIPSFLLLLLSLAEGFLCCLYFGNAFTSAIFFTRIRFRIPFDAVLIVLVAAFLSLALSRRKGPAPPTDSPKAEVF